MIGFCSPRASLMTTVILSPNFSLTKRSAGRSPGRERRLQLRYGALLRGAVKACRSGVRRCHLISYRKMARCCKSCSHATVSVRRFDGKRRADSSRNNQRYWRYSELIRPLEQQGILVRRSREQLRWKSTNSPLFSAITRLLPAPALSVPGREDWGNGLCGSSPDYRSSSRGEVLLERIAAQAKRAA